MLDPAFSFGMLKDKVPLFNEHALALVKDLETLVGKPAVDILDLIKCHYFNALSGKYLIHLNFRVLNLCNAFRNMLAMFPFC